MTSEPIPAGLLSLLRCPLSGQTLAVADPAQLTEGRKRWTALHSANETLPNAPTPSITEEFAAALIRADGKVLYPIRDGIPVLLSDEAIFL